MKYNQILTNDNEMLILCLLFYYLSNAYFTYILVVFDFQMWFFLMAVPDWRPPIPLERQKIYKDEWKNSCQNHRIIFEFCIQLLTSCWLSCWLTTNLFQAALLGSKILPAVVLCAGFSLAVGLLPAGCWPLICCAGDLPNLRAVVLSALAPIPLWPSFVMACCWPPGWTPIYTGCPSD